MKLCLAEFMTQHGPHIAEFFEHVFVVWQGNSVVDLGQQFVFLDELLVH